ncbi:MAG: UDP-N-acetylmuramate--L-alanine ligase, partial [Candidatus Caldatribacteriota bacterium]|nr:UDP-N-acetylmuramate--L-alanine ligase [Candidatus Caldatribacteriota bacterium]
FKEVKKSNHRQIKYLPSKDDILGYLSEIVQSGDIIITMGAGDIWTAGQELAEQLKKTKVF